MSTELTSGLCSTTGFTPQNTYLWGAALDGDLLTVSCAYGGGQNTNNLSTAIIPLGSTAKTALVQTPPNPAILVSGWVRAAWSAGNSSYVVTFSGSMVESGVTRVESSDQGTLPAIAKQIIVAAFLD
jgi:hypothetical protein